MSILVGLGTRLVVQGITGREGEFHTRASIAYGTNVVAGTRPGKGGQFAIDGTVPIFDTVAEAVREAGANTSVIYIPAAGAPDAILEAVIDQSLHGVLNEVVPDPHLLEPLSDAVDPPDPLLDAHRVPGHVIVDENPARLKV